MKVLIDNLAGQGAADCTVSLDATISPRIERKINQPARFSCSLLGGSDGFVVPRSGARVIVKRDSGESVFTGYLTEAPERECLGWGQRGSVYRYNLVAESDEILLDQRALPNRSPFVGRTAGSALRQLVEGLLPGGFDLGGVQDLDVLASYAANPQKKFSEHAAAIALAARASYRVMNDRVTLAPAGSVSYALAEGDSNFSPAGLKLICPTTAINDVTVIGLEEPQAYVRDYFVGDGMSLRFYLSQTPFQQNRKALINERYGGSDLDRATWMVSDPTQAFSVVAQALLVNGGSGQDGRTTVSFLEKIELGGALELQHGDVSFTGASQGVIGGLYAGSVVSTNCVAGFQVTPSGGQSNIQALINGVATGPVVTTTAGHRYLMTTYLYSREIYRSGEKFHSAAHPAGSGLGGDAVSAEVRIVLEVQDVNPLVPASMVTPAMVVFDGVIAHAPGFCSYALVNAVNMQCALAYTYAAHISTAEVRTALENSPYETRLVETQVEGGECAIVGSTTLDFYPQYVPPLNTLIVASYRGAGRAVAEVADTVAIAALANGADDGVRSVVRTMKAPRARTQVDCENAVLAILEDAANASWSGSYETWSDFLPGGAADIFPGDGLNVNAPSQNAVFSAIVRKVDIELRDPANDRGMYTIEFANDLAEPLSRQDEASGTAVPLQDLPVRLSTAQVGSYYLADLKDAQLTSVTSTTVQIDAGMTPDSGCGIEVRAHDYGWGPSDDRNLIGRFSARSFTLARLARTQNYFLRLYDTASPPRYSRYAAALHVDYPYD